MGFVDEDLDRALAVLEARALEEAGFARERAGAEREFFGGRIPRADLAGRRFREWFLLERPADAWQLPPIQELAHALVAEGRLDADLVTALSSSFCGVFEVVSVVEGRGAWLRDLLSGGEHPLADEEGSFGLAAGDVLIGRLFVLGPTAHRMSRAAAVFRDADLRNALERDVEVARARRRGVLRLSQRDLEAMFWRSQTAGAGEGAVGRARAWLAAAGVDARTIDRTLAELASTPCDRSRWAFGTQDALGAVLDRLAFETEVDMETARRMLLDAWLELWPDEPAGAQELERAEPEPRDVRAALEAFDRGRSQGRDLEGLFAQLERDLGLDGEEDDAPDAAPDFPGVVGAVIEEFLWETERERGAEAARALAPIRRLAEYGQGIGVFENLGARDLLAFASVWLPEHGELGGAEDARATLDALRAFCEWAAERQGIELTDAFRATLDSLSRSLPRIAEANHRLGSRAERGGELYELKQIGANEMRLADARGGLHPGVVPPAVAERLVAGDRLRAATTRDGALTILRCYPPESAPVLARP